jgi:UDP-GlcNAc:undecaprenyl-phosphate GlcNAc-1-phosphate transferase
MALAISYAITPLVIKLAWKWGLIDDPKKNRHPKVIHSKPTPRGGGLSLFLAIAISASLLLPLDKHLAGILAGAGILVLMGILDDRYNLNPYLRLMVQFFAVSIPIAAGIGIAFLNSPFGIIDLSYPRIEFFLLGETRSIWILSDLFALFWMVALMNFINWGAKGVDGQLSGVVTIAALVIAVLSFRFSADITEWPVTILAAILAGASLGFLPWHMYPQKIMPGFSGSNLTGFLLGVLSILTTTKVGTLFLVLGVPLIDSGYTLIRRILQGKSPVWGDGGHLHHRLLDVGWSKKGVAYFYWLVTAILGIIALWVNWQWKLYTILGLAFLLAGLILWLTFRPEQRST